MEYEGKLLTVSELLAASMAAPSPVWTDRSLRHNVVSNAAMAATMLADGDDVTVVWRLAVIQTLDDYISALERGGVDLARRVFELQPAPTGAAEIDAAFASLAEYLAHRDGWDVPEWTASVPGVAQWYPDVPSIYLDAAMEQSPEEFRRRGIFITDLSLARA